MLMCCERATLTPAWLLFWPPLRTTSENEHVGKPGVAAVFEGSWCHYSNKNQECQTATHRKQEGTRRRKSGVNKAERKLRTGSRRLQGAALPVIPKLDNWPQQIPGTTSEISADAWSHGAAPAPASGGGRGAPGTRGRR